jgi:hypothetical protein
MNARPSAIPRLGALAAGVIALAGAPASARAESASGGATLDERLDLGAHEAPAIERWAGMSFGWDVHVEAISLFKHYTIGDAGAWYSGQGAGGGASASLHFRPPAAIASGVLRWIEFELGAGSSAHWVSWEEGRGARRGTDFISSQTYAIIGAHLASGRWAGDAGEPWSGAVLGLAWVPTYVHFFGNDDFASGGKLNHAGLRLSVDWGRVSPTAKGLVPGLRAFLTWLPYIGSLPTVVSAGVGCVFY